MSKRTEPTSDRPTQPFRAVPAAKPVHGIGADQSTLCGQWAAHSFASTSDVEQITCRRCLAVVGRMTRNGAPR